MDQNQDIVAGLDIGTTKIACIVGRKNEQGKIEILGMGKATQRRREPWRGGQHPEDGGEHRGGRAYGRG
jgi:hypothetical protein